jgi:hypothetical protein
LLGVTDTLKKRGGGRMIGRAIHIGDGDVDVRGVAGEGRGEAVRVGKVRVQRE